MFPAAGLLVVNNGPMVLITAVELQFSAETPADAVGGLLNKRKEKSMAWYFCTGLFAVLAIVSVIMTIYTQVKFHFNGCPCLFSWFTTIAMGAVLSIAAFRTANGESKFILDDWGEVFFGVLYIALRYFMFFSNPNERRKKTRTL